MSARELTRVEVLSRVKAGTLSVGSAATVLGVSYRQAKRLARRYRTEGAKGLQHRSAGGASNHARPTAERERVQVHGHEHRPIDVADVSDGDNITVSEAGRSGGFPTETGLSEGLSGKFRTQDFEGDRDL